MQICASGQFGMHIRMAPAVDFWFLILRYQAHKIPGTTTKIKQTERSSSSQVQEILEFGLAITLACLVLHLKKVYIGYSACH